MKRLHLIATAVLAGSLGLPAVVQAQVGIAGSGASNYGIFGGGTNTGAFGRSSGFGQSQSGGFSGASSSSFGRSALGAGASPTLSPYLNMLRPGSAAVNYYALVRPQVRQDAINTQTTTTMQQTDRQLADQQQRLRQEVDQTLANADLSSGDQKAGTAGQAKPRRRVNDEADADFHDWASDFRQSSQSGAKSARDSRQTEANLRRAKELKALEDELASDGSTTAAPASQTAGARQNNAPSSLSSYRSPNHYFPTPGVAANRLGTPR